MKFLPFCFAALLLPAAAIAADPFAEGVRSTDPLPPSDQLETFRLPAGFEIQLVANEPDINKPMNMAFDTDGRLWVTTSREYPYAAPPDRPGRDRLMIFEDFGPDGRARKVTEFADGLNIPIGVYPFRSKSSNPTSGPAETWKAVVWSIPNIWLMEDLDGDGVADRRVNLYGPFDYTRDVHGNQSSFTRGFNGWLYATHGFNNHSIVTGRDGNTVDMHSGNTYRMRLDGERIEHHTFGQVNPFGLAWDERGNLYSSDCHSAPIYQLLAGGYYPSFGKPHDGLGFAPVMMEHAHGSTAIDGAFYYSDNLWPEEYQDTFMIGNVMTSRLNRDRIEFVGSTPVAHEQPDFLTSTDPWFRPVHNILGPDGALYIADFYNRIIGHYEVPLDHPGRDQEKGRIWRVVYTGTDGMAKPGHEKHLRPVALPDDLEGLAAELGSPNLTRRLLAMNEIDDRFGLPSIDVIRGVYDSTDNEHQRIHALWLLERWDDCPDAMLETAFQEGGPLMRVHVLRMIAERGRLADGLLSDAPRDHGFSEATRRLAIEALEDSDALVRRCAAEALGTVVHASPVRPLLDALSTADRQDTHLVYVLRKSLRNQLRDDALFAEIAGRFLGEEDVLAIADVAVAVPTEVSGSFLIDRLETLETDRELARRALEHATRYAPPADLEKLVQTVREQPDAGLDFQLGLFRSIREGYSRRGTELTPAMKDWTGELAMTLLRSVAASDGWKNEPLDNTPASGNPWAFQERVQSDNGQPARMLSSFPNGETLTGRLVSAPFKAPNKLSFFLAGHDGYPDQPMQGRNYVQLKDVETGEVLASVQPPRNDAARRVEWELAEHAGRSVQLEVVDGDTAGAYAWLAIGRFQPGVLSLPELSPATVASRQTAAAELFLSAGVSREADTPLRSALLALAQNRNADLQSRAAALNAVRPASEHLAGLVQQAAIPYVWRQRILDSLTGVDNGSSDGLPEDLWSAAPTRVQAIAASALIDSGITATRMMDRMREGNISKSLLASRSFREKLLSLSDEANRQAIEEMVSQLPEADLSIQKLIEERRNGFNTFTADAAKGKELFELLCQNCHQLDGAGSLIGPQLDGIGNRGAERLFEDILDPNRNVDPAFRSVSLVLKNGEVETGLFRREEGALLVLANAAGQEFTVPASQVEKRVESNQSLMPSNFGEALTAEQLNDLVAFVLGR